MLSREITSLQHPFIKHLVRLRKERSYRYASKKILLSGKKLIEELPSNICICTLLIDQRSRSPIQAKELVRTSPEILKKITGLENPEPIAAEIIMPENPDFSRANALLIIDGVADPGNLGTLIRSARGLGWDGVYLTERSADPYNEKALRAAKGATFTLPWKYGSSQEILNFLHRRGITLYAAEACGEPFSYCSISSPFALALGNEAHGISSSLKNEAVSISIPLHGRIESLNVAAAGSILMFELKERSHGQ